MIDRIQWLGHGSFLIQGPPLIYINPWRVARTIFHADVILITHDHYQHCSEADVEKLCGPDTIVISNDKAAQVIHDTTILRPWQCLSIDRASIKAVPAYSPNDWRHPQSDGGLGFVISVNYYDIYYAGDTQIIPEMSTIKPDIAILPIDGNGTLNIEDAVEVVRMMRPQYAIPSNWGNALEGATRVDALAFERQASEYTRIPLLT